MSKSFAEKILELRTEKKISQRELGEAIGVSPLSVFNYEKGVKQPRRNTLVKLAAYFNVPIEYFYEHKYEPKTALVSIVSAGGGASSNTLKYRVNLSNKWMQIMGITQTNRAVDLFYKDKTIIIQKPDTFYDDSYEKASTHIMISSSGGGSTPGTQKYMVVLLNNWMKDMKIFNTSKETRTVTLEFDGEKITITKKEL